MDDLRRDDGMATKASTGDALAEFLASQERLEKKLAKLNKKLKGGGKGGGKKRKRRMRGLSEFGAKVIGSVISEVLKKKFSF